MSSFAEVGVGLLEKAVQEVQNLIDECAALKEQNAQLFEANCTLQSLYQLANMKIEHLQKRLEENSTERVGQLEEELRLARLNNDIEPWKKLLADAQSDNRRLFTRLEDANIYGELKAAQLNDLKEQIANLIGATIDE